MGDEDERARVVRGAPGSARARLAPLAALVVAALLFGSTFVIVKDAMSRLPALAFVGWRFLLGAVVLLLFGWPRRETWRDGSIAGVLLFAGYWFQTEGLRTTTATSSGLITGLYVVFTPMLAAALARRRPGGLIFAAAALAFLGLALLTWQEAWVPRGGDVLTLGCAVAFAGHVLSLGFYAPRHSAVRLTAVQLVVVAGLALTASAALEGLPRPGLDSVAALVLTGLGASAGAFLLQVWAQGRVGPSRTAIVLALEPAFAAGFGAVLLGERLSGRGWLGAALVLVAIYLALFEADPAAGPVEPTLAPP